MKKLYDYTKILRSKNAGPLYITFDLIFESEKELEYVKANLNREMVAKAYDVDESSVDIISYDRVNSLKITFPRKNISGSLDDEDIYGCQQHVPLSEIVI